MNTKLPLLALILGLSGALGAQNAATKTVPLAKNMKPYSWLMRPTSEFFAETGLSAGDSVSANTYRVGTGSETVLVNVGHVNATNQDVVWYVAYENFKIKNLMVVVDSIKANYDINTSDEGVNSYWLSDALVKIASRVDEKSKTGTVGLDAIPLYKYMPPVEQGLAKLDSSWQQLITNVQFGTRSVERDSSEITVRIKNVTPLVSYSIYYPFEEGRKPYMRIDLNEGNGYGAMKWACKNYYERFYDAFEGGTVWVSDTDQPTVKLGILFDNGNLLNMEMTQAQFAEMAGSDE